MNNVSSSNNDTIKREMLKALKNTLGVVSPACELVGISRNTHYTWMKTDENYKKEVDDLLDFQLDFVESKLFENINSGDTGSAIFYLKTKGKHRGYIEKREYDHTSKGESINIISLGSGKKPNEAT